ncbi:MAG TPA: prepilin-type N-terminal cleavage/methylation domain-containing protein [Candidatus Woesebacteria bacterium]|nr:prepilin-type N-terminal cleavage/methylation domain-containing protein [Candidatus Woesebacteria bacterium]
MKKNTDGFTLLEVMIFTTILSIVLVSAAAFTTRLVYNLRINEHKVYANIAASELLEWITSERESDWNRIYNAAGDAPGGNTYCINSNLSLQTTITSFTAGACTFNGITGRDPQIFKRELILVRNGPNQVTATVRVSWREGDTTYADEIQGIYTSW